jgi:O-antigen ligase
MILFLGITITIFFAIYALKSTSYKNPLIVFIILSPIVAAAWNYRYVGFSLLDIFYSFFIFLFLLRVMLKKEDLSEFPYLKLFKFYFILILFVSLYVGANSGIVDSLDFFVKSLFMPIAFYVFLTYFTDFKSGKFLAAALILSGLFPLFFILSQKLTGNVWFYRQTRGLTRYVGLYHDAATLDIFLIQALIGIMLFWHYFLRKRQQVLKYSLVVLFCLLLAGSYFLYTKTIFLTFALWLLAFLFMKRRVRAFVSILVLLFFLNSISGQKIFSEINQVFSKEVELVGGNLNIEAALSGRGGMWKNAMNFWSKLPFLEKTLGAGKIYGGVHNDYLRMLLSGGLLLLVFSVFLFATLILAVIKDFHEKKYFIHLAAILCILYYFIVSLGRVPGLYPNLQILTWGLVGLSLNMKEDLDRYKE